MDEVIAITMRYAGRVVIVGFVALLTSVATSWALDRKITSKARLRGFGAATLFCCIISGLSAGDYLGTNGTIFFGHSFPDVHHHLSKIWLVFAAILGMFLGAEAALPDKEKE